MLGAFAGTIGETSGRKAADDGFNNVTLVLSVGIFVEEAIDTSSTKGSSGNSLTLGASPAARLFSTVNSFNDTSE
jgi:hypothetical protein